MREAFNPNSIELTKYLFYTGKGGVGKTSTACATAVSLADKGKKVLLISTDPASNLQDVFEIQLNSKGIAIPSVPGLVVANLDPLKAAAEYRESVVAPFRDLLPKEVITNMEEQLSGSCTVEIAAFNEFSNFITDQKAQNDYDHIIFDTAPTGHTLRMLQLPSAWSGFISESTHGASCLGQLSGLEERKDIYKLAVATLSNTALTTLILVTRPEEAPLKEATRASKELKELGIRNQILIVNGILETVDDSVSKSLYNKQKNALENLPEELNDIDSYMIPLRAYNVMGIDNIRSFFNMDSHIVKSTRIDAKDLARLQDVVDDLYLSGKKVIFTMGKGGVGKTTVAAAIALRLAEKGCKVHLSTTDPAAHLKYIIDEQENISMSHIDEQAVLKKYQETVLNKARANNLSEDDIAYIEEDLRSPCTQEIAVFREFANIVERADKEIVVIDTAPTGHTLLLLDSTQSYHKEVQRTLGDTPESVKKLLPRLRNDKETAVLIVTLAEATPVFEALRLEEDLQRASIQSKWWVINSSLFATETTNLVLRAKASNEIEWINEVKEHSNGNVAVISWHPEELKGEKLKNI
ncbi:arsenical pump-driving ATPase [Lachnoclostridium sp.]|uniref:arsenical pump-driving ATPase n=1 Tax=Lachnoclostridium sp. TaxID=2028282 RepID=UPI00289C33F9|nr:arsenical pump-driving ATPase [Lachnoclostridium sp.]